MNKQEQIGGQAFYNARLFVRGTFCLMVRAMPNSKHPSHVSGSSVFYWLTTMLGWSVDHVDMEGALLYANPPESNRIIIRLPNKDGIKAASGQYARLSKSL